jgi:NAD(P)-dependent dehydrogenase (short-subunit alcohol dehydrogenase family)
MSVKRGLGGKVVVVTGASGGLGPAVVDRLIEDGARVCGVSRSWKGMKDERFVLLEADLTKSGGAAAVVSDTLERAGRIDALVHLMGGFAGGDVLEKTDDQTLERMLDLNLRSAFFMMRDVIPHLRAQKRGRIVAVGSRTGVDPSAGLSAYGASKAALVSLVRSVALELAGSGVTANVVLPSMIDTAQNRAADPGADHSGWVSPASIAELIAYLLSDAAADVNGAAIPIYGGA